ncbi:flagellar basal body L-ring protein FlgH [Sphingopyxis sp. L1A2A]|uniref:flagellar basal body L-ring protein FlgH n=1 Tax=Sphingopyxis sp. L1A2A TaxID=2502247 RepID=UPI0010F99C1D|nr:flagellar basal body L-ring protein FlgH [Sphingopyxis sp. L1A2A]
MPRRRSNLSVSVAFALALVPVGAAAKDKLPADAFAAATPVPPAPLPGNGSIFQGSYVPLTSGGRAGQVGDILTIQLVERTAATKSNAAGTQRDGNIGLTPPSTGPLSLFNPSDIAMGGGQQFKGKGDASQSNALSGEVSVTIAAVYPNGTMLVRGEKLLTLNRGDERVQISGIVRAMDISPDNRILSTRVADANIRYVGKGEIARASQQGWLQRFFAIISPF